MSHKIIDAIRNSQYSQLFLFLKYNYNFKIKSANEGNNVLMAALEISDATRRMKMLKFLLNLDLVNILDDNNFGQDLFFVAVINECEEEIKYLMKYYNAEVNWTKKDNFGKTLLHYAVMNNNLNILQLLLNYCAKYKINVDIPDSFNKITPYLLACRLHHDEAAELLTNMTNASKNQTDQSVFYDAERWKQEGQLEKLESYLKEKKEQMDLAKINGKIKVCQELNGLTEILDKKVYKNPEIFPILTQAISDNVKNMKQSLKNFKSKSASNERFKITETSTTTMTKNEPVSLSARSLNSNNNFSSKSEIIFNEKSQTLPTINKIIKQTFSLVMNKPDEANLNGALIPNVESLIGMSQNGESPLNFVSSKPDMPFTTRKIHPNVTLRSNSYSHNKSNPGNLLSLSDIFTEVSIQTTNSFRAPAKKYESAKANKSNNNSFYLSGRDYYKDYKNKMSTLAILREESRNTKLPKKAKLNHEAKKN